MKMTNESPLEAEVVEVALLVLDVKSVETTVVERIHKATCASRELVICVLAAMAKAGLVVVSGPLLWLTDKGYEALIELLESEAPAWTL